MLFHIVVHNCDDIVSLGTIVTSHNVKRQCDNDVTISFHIVVRNCDESQYETTHSHITWMSRVTQINLNKQKLGEPQVYLKPVEHTPYSAAVPIWRNDSFTYHMDELCRTYEPFHVCEMTHPYVH